MIILRILMWIIILILVAACIPICIELKHFSNEDLVLIKWLFLKYKIYPFEKQEKETKQTTKKTTKAKPKEEKETKDETNFTEYIYLISPILKSIKKPLIYLCKTIKITFIDFIWAIGSEDACQTSINYGKYSGVFWIFYSLLSDKFTVKSKNINIYPDFLSEHSSFNVHIRICLIPILAVIIGIWLVVSVLINILIATVKNKGANKNESTSD